MAVYEVKAQWGGSAAPWNKEGTWMLGTRKDQDLLAVDIGSPDNGQTLLGRIAYCCEGPIDFRAVRMAANAYFVTVHWGSDPIWHDDGIWIIGGRNDQRCTRLSILYNPMTKEFNGTAAYQGEGEIGFKASNLGNQTR